MAITTKDARIVFDRSVPEVALRWTQRTTADNDAKTTTSKQLLRNVDDMFRSLMLTITQLRFYHRPSDSQCNIIDLRLLTVQSYLLVTGERNAGAGRCEQLQSQQQQQQQQPGVMRDDG